MMEELSPENYILVDIKFLQYISPLEINALVNVGQVNRAIVRVRVLSRSLTFPRSVNEEISVPQVH